MEKELRYISTRGKAPAVSAEEAIRNGIAPDGGLYLPSFIPLFTEEEWHALPDMTYQETALTVLRKYLPSVPAPELSACISEAYSSFGPSPVKIAIIDEKTAFLELWHGPTAAFKDMALQLFPRLLSVCKKASGSEELTWILTATSGDTGKAALEGFRDVPGTFVSVFYPDGGVSRMQELQMRTQEGSNVDVCAVRGNFDDAQSAVKRLFADEDLRKQLAARNIRLSSANSINWGRLLPQIVYYVYTSEKLFKRFGEPFDFVVPTGNFGNILAGYFAKRMGCPIRKLFCASNENDVLTDFFKNGIYDRKRELVRTASPSMDILVSSNLERLLYLETKDADLVSGWMNDLQETGSYCVPEELSAQFRDVFDCGEAYDDETAFEAIRACYEQYAYVMDPHTAVGYAAFREEAWPEEPDGPVVYVSTASPFKFAPSVVYALTGESLEAKEAVGRLEELSSVKAPESLSALFRKPVRFSDAVGPEQITEEIKDRILKMADGIR